MNTTALPGDPSSDRDPDLHFLSEEDCRDIVQRLARFTTNRGYTSVALHSAWRGNIRWARNQISTSGEAVDNVIRVGRNINGAEWAVDINDPSDAGLIAAVRRAERLANVANESPNSNLIPRLPLEAETTPSLFSERTYRMDASQRAMAAIESTKQAREAGLLSAGYIEVAAVGMGVLDTVGRVRYFAYTQARYSVTVRDPQGTGSGWAGIDWYDWNKIDTTEITTRALNKCLKSRNPVTIEPGRYTTILEPQATVDFIGPLMQTRWIGRNENEGYSIPHGPFLKSAPTATAPGYSKLGERVVDERITIGADPMDPELGFPPFSPESDGLWDPFENPVFHPVTWIDRGVLVNLATPRFSQRTNVALGRDENLGMPNSGAFRMTGGDTTVAEMIATSKRALLVTRLIDVLLLDAPSQLYRGFTRDGLWLIEDGKISKPVKNMVFTESILFALNNVEQLGRPERVFHPNVRLKSAIPQPAIVPALKIRDFSFTALTDAV